MRPFLLALVAAALVVAGCGDDSTSTGSGGSTSSNPASGGADGSGGDDTGSADGGGGTTAATSPTSSSIGPGAGGGGGSSIDPDAAAPLAEGVRIERLVALQTTSVPLMENDAIATPPEPIVAGRDLWIRGFLVAAAATPVRLEVVVVSSSGDAQVFTSAAATPTAGLDDDPSTTPFVQIPAARVTTGATFSARVVRDGAAEVGPGAARDERFPRDGSRIALPAETMPPLQLTLLPFSWDGDESGRLPDTSPAALEIFRALFIARYPVADVQITVHDVIPYDRGLDLDGDVDFNDVNDLLYDLREEESPPASAYWFGLLKPADSFDDYCFGTCTTGQSYVADSPEDYDLRVGAGVAFNSEDGAATAVHEVGHQFGRYHAPCYVSSWDEDFPYEDGIIGVLGWDPRDATPLDPYETTDFMGYCDPQGTSDYTYAALAERSRALANLSFAPRPSRRDAARVTCTKPGP